MRRATFRANKRHERSPTPSITTRRTCEADAPLLLAIEQSAAMRFLALPDLTWIADLPLQEVGRHVELSAGGLCRVATIDGRIAGFLDAEATGDDLHVWELSVAFERQRQGVGRALIEAAIGDAKKRGLTGLTLTTFRDVPWNAPYYEKAGFRVVPEAQITDRLRDILDREIAAGLPGERRCAMRLDLGD